MPSKKIFFCSEFLYVVIITVLDNVALNPKFLSCHRNKHVTLHVEKHVTLHVVFFMFTSLSLTSFLTMYTITQRQRT